MEESDSDSDKYYVDWGWSNASIILKTVTYLTYLILYVVYLSFDLKFFWNYKMFKNFNKLLFI
jgi:hypothetical protein